MPCSPCRASQRASAPTCCWKKRGRRRHRARPRCKPSAGWSSRSWGASTGGIRRGAAGEAPSLDGSPGGGGGGIRAPRRRSAIALRAQRGAPLGGLSLRARRPPAREGRGAPARPSGRGAGRPRGGRGAPGADRPRQERSEEHTSELQSRLHLVCRLLLEKKKKEKNRLEG